MKKLPNILGTVGTTTEGSEDRAVVVIEQLNERVEKLELRIALGSLVTEDRASQIGHTVKSAAVKLPKTSGRNKYGGVYGELYRKFGITDCKQLPAAKFDEAIKWLNEWRESIEDDVPC